MEHYMIIKLKNGSEAANGVNPEFKRDTPFLMKTTTDQALDA